MGRPALIPCLHPWDTHGRSACHPPGAGTRPALAAVLGHCELDAVVLAATVAHGAGADGWGPEWSQVTPGGRRSGQRALTLRQARSILQEASGTSPRAPPPSYLRPRSRGFERATQPWPRSKAWLCFSPTNGTQAMIRIWVLWPSCSRTTQGTRTCCPASQPPAQRAQHQALLRVREAFGAQGPAGWEAPEEQEDSRGWEDPDTPLLVIRPGRGAGVGLTDSHYDLRA